MSTLKDFYERTSSRFWNPLEGLVGRDLQVFPLIPDNGGTMLEYGFGSGSLLFSAAKELTFSKVLGIDISEKVIKKAETKIVEINQDWCKKFEFSLSQNERIPHIPDESVDVIVSVATIEHVLDPYVVLDELYRITRPGGTLVCSVPNYAYLKYRINLLMGNLPITGTNKPVKYWRETGWDGMHIHTFTKEAFNILLKDCGWSPERWTGWGTKLPAILKLRKKFPQLLSGELIAVCKKGNHPHMN